MVINLYKINNDNRDLNKSPILVAGPLQCTIKDNCTILSPDIVLAYDIKYLSANYAYIADYNRWYYADNPTLVTGGQMILHCTVDAIMSWRNYIRAINTVIDRQEFVNSPLVSDSKYILRNDRHIDRYVIGSAITQQGYYITVNGGVENNG